MALRHGQPIDAGIVTALVGFASSFAVVLAGLRAVGATDNQAASGLLALVVALAVCAIALAWSTRLPLIMVWSISGAALLAAAGGLSLGWNEAVGAFLVCGVLIAVTSAVPALGRLVATVPVPPAQTMLAGVLFEFCLAPFAALATVPWQPAPVVLA